MVKLFSFKYYFVSVLKFVFSMFWKGERVPPVKTGRPESVPPPPSSAAFSAQSLRAGEWATLQCRAWGWGSN